MPSVFPSKKNVKKAVIQVCRNHQKCSYVICTYRCYNNRSVSVGKTDCDCRSLMFKFGRTEDQWGWCRQAMKFVDMTDCIERLHQCCVVSYTFTSWLRWPLWIHTGRHTLPCCVCIWQLTVRILCYLIVLWTDCLNTARSRSVNSRFAIEVTVVCDSSIIIIIIISFIITVIIIIIIVIIISTFLMITN